MNGEDCAGCSWLSAYHEHDDAEDGPRATCCAHTCDRDILAEWQAQYRALHAPCAVCGHGAGSHLLGACRVTDCACIVCPWDATSGDECSMMREREVAGISDHPAACPAHGAFAG